jgi:hypothetical protein
MGKLLAVDDLEIRFEKQHPSHASKWCIYIRAKLGEKTKSLLMIKTDNKPYTAFNYDNGRTVTHSQEAKEEILSDKTKNISNLERAYHNASNSTFKTMWLKKIYQLQGNNGKK